MVNLEELRVQRLLEGSLIHLGMHRVIRLGQKVRKNLLGKILYLQSPISPITAQDQDNHHSVLQLLLEAGHVQGQPAAHHWGDQQEEGYLC